MPDTNAALIAVKSRCLDVPRNTGDAPENYTTGVRMGRWDLARELLAIINGEPEQTEAEADAPAKETR
jgi:hypothetical protein